jgi:outer membrane receptor for ferrienterochelin and colicin
LTFAGYYSSYDTLNVKRFDPRLAIVDKASDNMVFRASVGSGFAAPRISDLQPFLNTSHFSATAFGGCPTSEPFCAASDGNPNLKSETAIGYDLGFERLFGNGGDLNVDLYRTNLHNHIFTGFVPAPPGTPTFDNGSKILFLNLPINLAGTVYTGLESNATIPVGNYLSVDPYYSIQSAYPTDVPLAVAQTIGDVVNKQQYLGVPIHKLGWTLNYHTISRATTVSFGGDWYARNNSYNIYPFWVYNASATVPLGESTLHVGWTNIFNTQAALFSSFRGGLPYPGAPGCNLNGNGPCAAGDQYLTNLYQRAPHMLTVTFDRRWGSLR